MKKLKMMTAIWSVLNSIMPLQSINQNQIITIATLSLPALHLPIPFMCFYKLGAGEGAV